MSINLKIVIVNFNLAKDTIESVRSFLKAGANLSQIIVVDNGSTDDSAQQIRSAFGSELSIIRSEEVLGNAHGLNLGIRAAQEHDFEWALLMNNDTYVDQQFLVEMEHAISGHPEFRIFGPMIFFAGQPERIWFLGHHLVPGTLITRDPYRLKTADKVFSEIKEMDFINGCSMLIHRSVFDRIGLFDASLFMYGEEVDFFLRARKAGFRMAAAPKARMWHKVSATMNQDKPGTRYLRIRNQSWVYRRHGNPGQILLMFLFSSFRVIYMTLREVFSEQRALIKPTWAGFFEGWFTRMPSFLE